MQSWITELNALAKDLLSRADGLEETIREHQDKAPTGDALKKFADMMSAMCKALEAIDAIMYQAGDPLTWLVERVDGAKSAGDVKRDLNRFIESHQQALNRIGVPEGVTRSLIERLRKDTENREPSRRVVDIEAPETLLPDDAAGIRGDIRRLREVVCEISKQADRIAEWWDAKLLKACVDSVRGVCWIVIDITGAASAPDITGFVLLKAIKSTWYGARILKRGLEQLESRWKSMKASMSARDQREKMPKPPRNPLKRRGDKPEK